MNVLLKRITTICFILPIILYIVVFFNSKVFIFFSLFIYYFIIYEWLSMNEKNKNIFFVLIFFLTYFLPIIYFICFPNTHQYIYFYGISFWIIISIYISYYPKYKFFWKNIFLNRVIEILIIPLSFLSFFMIHSKHYNIILFICLIPCFFDISSYLFGSFYGRNKFFEKVTPKKTWEGIFGGFLSLISLFVYLKFTFNNFFFLSWMIILILIIFSIIGDLIESIYKRISLKKDSGNLLPGHGGMLDRLDSSIPVISIAYGIYIFDLSYKYFYI